MITHKQKSTKQKGFWQPEIINNVLQATTYYFRDLEISIPETDLSILQNGDKVYIENNDEPLYLIKNGIKADYAPLSGGNDSSPGAVIWMENGEVHILSNIKE